MNEWVTELGRVCMNANIFDILIVIALGALTGVGIGVLIGSFAKKQKGEWSAMTQKDRTLNIALMIVCCAICISGLAYYSLV